MLTPASDIGVIIDVKSALIVNAIWIRTLTSFDSQTHAAMEVAVIINGCFEAII